MPPPVPERLAAIAAGERYYFTGKPCRNGHIAKRYAKSGLCSSCGVAKQLRFQMKPDRNLHPARAAAKAAGLPRYSTREPCDHGHVAERMVSSGQCIVCKAAARKRFFERNPGKEAQWARERRAKDPSGHRAEAKRWAQKNPERVSAANKRWSAENPEKKRALYKRWIEANREHIRAYNRERNRVRRGLRGNANGGSYTAADIEAIRDRQGNVCAACARALRLEIDHIVPITKGGTNHPSNIQLLCRGCNSSKHNHDFETWLPSKGYTVASLSSI